MRLLNAKSWKLESFEGTEKPPYAILSHTWGSEEILYQHMSGSLDGLDFMEGYQKILGCCKQAISDGYQYVWVDTCCIDKTSSAELSEAINSMFQWYQDAVVCYAYLSDVKLDDDPKLRDSEISKESQMVSKYPWRNHSKLSESKWFTRGWTLQELIAPEDVVFYDSKWIEIGTKNSLRSILSTITSIDIKLFVNTSYKKYSIAQRMSWASNRMTTRLEDEAYCLMGIFGVNMPLLYGEGKKAFLRLQEEIMSRSDDHSLFAWCGPSGWSTGLLAPSPREFSKSGSIERLKDSHLSLPYSITNKGVQISFPLVQPFDDFGEQKLWQMFEVLEFFTLEIRTLEKSILSEEFRLTADMTFALLNCQLSNRPGQSIGIVLQKSPQDGVYFRDHVHIHLIIELQRLYEAGWKDQAETIFVEPPEISTFPPYILDDWYIVIRTLPSQTHGFYILEQYPKSTRFSCELPQPIYLRSSGHAVLLFSHSSRVGFAVILERNDGRLYASVERCVESENAKSILESCMGKLTRQDRITYKLDQEQMISVVIKRIPASPTKFYMVDISIQ